MRWGMTAGLLLVMLTGLARGQFLPRPGTGGGRAAAPNLPLAGGIAPPAPSFGGFSPYLNLTQGRGTSAAVSYYGIVRPQLNLQASIQELQQQQAQAGSSMLEPDDPLLPGVVVGTRPRFLNTGGYFLNLNGMSGPIGPIGAAPGRMFGSGLGGLSTGGAGSWAMSPVGSFGGGLGGGGFGSPSAGFGVGGGGMGGRPMIRGPR